MEDRKKAARARLGELNWTPEDHRLFPPAARAAAMLIVYGFGSLEGDFLNGPGLLVAQYAAREAVKEELAAGPTKLPTRHNKPPTAVTSSVACHLTVPRLKEELRARGLRVGGTKPELLERLLEPVGEEDKGRCLAAWLAVDRVVGGPAGYLARPQAHSC